MGGEMPPNFWFLIIDRGIVLKSLGLIGLVDSWVKQSTKLSSNALGSHYHSRTKDPVAVFFLQANLGEAKLLALTSIYHILSRHSSDPND
ncbi:hypothetical protein PGT21_034704 [Puccinia graminis f. sp. tritici]|uniref:Uncharacterized protein n=1 Tax=Puccinia graminis f. sp. tritici TaxID=56615 RepID=A0A5B0NUH5_PUCGR|nr:hypothetical protein PGT21_034704 [Puccinia graminis f. sp. tritici]KAA1134737.1 hypothetical protein PGTUg99_012002 [Puccinia graminis f. sp. tritici]